MMPAGCASGPAEKAPTTLTAQILLIRHAAHAHLGHILSGRTPGIALSEPGRAQAMELARRLSAEPVAAIHSSPVQRARETAQAIAEAHQGIAVTTAPALDELDFGDWAGREFAELAHDPSWDDWNRARATAVAPNGESMAEAQRRAWDHVATTAAQHAGGTVVMVSHCDVIRAVVAAVLGLSLDHVHAFDVGPGSITRLAVGDWGARLTGLNEICHER